MTHRNSIILPHNSSHLYSAAWIAGRAIGEGRLTVLDHQIAFTVGGAHFDDHILARNGGEGEGPTHPRKGWVKGWLDDRIGPGAAVIERHLDSRDAAIAGGREAIDILVARID